MTQEQRDLIKLWDEWKARNVQINRQLKRAGKPLPEMPESAWKSWMIELIKYRDGLTSKLEQLDPGSFK